YLAKGFNPRDATLKAMEEVTGPVVAIALVLCAVFVPTAFLGGITGEFYRQFALTIAASTVISAINSLTLSPALAALLLRHHEAKPDLMSRMIEGLLGWFFRIFNRTFGALSDMYARSIAKIIRHTVMSLMLYGGLIAFAVYAFQKVPTGFIPSQDMGYFMTVIQLPDGASFERSDEIVRRVDEIARSTPGVAHTFAISGYSNVLQANQSNLGACFIIPDEFENRTDPSLSAEALMATLRKKFADIQEARVLVLPPPPLRGLGNAGGFKLQVEDLNNAGLAALETATKTFIDALAKEPGFSSLITGFRSNNPQYNLVIDRERAKTMNVSISAINDTLQTYLGSTYVNDFNLFGRTWQVMAMAEPEYRMKPEDIGRLRTRNSHGEMVPLGALVKTEKIGGADRVQRYNMFVSSDISGNTSADISSGDMIRRVAEVAKASLPDGFDYEWTDLTYQQTLAGNSIVYIFPLCVLFVFLVLSAQYESWALPLAVILIVPMCLLSAIGGVWITGMDNNIFTQIGLVVLVGLASKNAILIVEFARQQQDHGMSRFEAAVEACRLRLRPILMTSFAFILGVLPLVLAKGAGAEMRNALGTAVFYGMLGVTFFGLIFTPVFYVVISKFMGERKVLPATEGEKAAHGPAPHGNAPEPHAAS
ncbi:MAG TPA: efflux RND transporter permease subunit, partial [Verrucomicrobium sp.]|nr:efflux RND transporter permease subunit [Verrucomicrobium sp.]